MGKEVSDKCAPKVLRTVEKRAILASHVPLVTLPPPAQPCPGNPFPLFCRGCATTLLPCGVPLSGQTAPFFIGLQNQVLMTLVRKWSTRLGPPKRDYFHPVAFTSCLAARASCLCHRFFQLHANASTRGLRRMGLVRRGEDNRRGPYKAMPCV